MKYRTFVEVLDAAYRGDLDPLNMLVYAMLRASDPDRDEIRNNALFAIFEIMKKTNEPSVTLAKKIGGIVKNHRLRVWDRERKVREIPSSGDDTSVLDIPDFTNDPAEALARMERIRELVEVHEKIGVTNPRQFEIILADLRGDDAAERVKETLGEDLEPATIRQSRKRAHDHANRLKPDARKDDKS